MTQQFFVRLTGRSRYRLRSTLSHDTICWRGGHARRGRRGSLRVPWGTWRGSIVRFIAAKIIIIQVLRYPVDGDWCRRGRRLWADRVWFKCGCSSSSYLEVGSGQWMCGSFGYSTNWCWLRRSSFCIKRRRFDSKFALRSRWNWSSEACWNLIYNETKIYVITYSGTH